MDTANYKDFIIVNAGVRYDDYHISAANNTSSQSANDGITSYNVGLVVKPVKIGSVYFAYATAADPVGAELDATSSTYGGLAATQNATQIFGPQKSRSYEIGTKWELVDRHLLVSAALFQTDVTNARETAPAGLPGYTSGQIVAERSLSRPRCRLRGGGQAHRQVERDGRPRGDGSRRSRKLDRADQRGPATGQHRAPSFNLLTKYQVTDRLELGGQGVYASKIEGGSLLAANGGIAYPGAPNPTFLPSHWRFDVFAEARINPRTEREALCAEPLRTRPTMTPSIRALSRSFWSRRGVRSI